MAFIISVIISLLCTMLVRNELVSQTFLKIIDETGAPPRVKYGRVLLSIWRPVEVFFE